jgi:hypothetical protein
MPGVTVASVVPGVGLMRVTVAPEITAAQASLAFPAVVPVMT